MVISGNPTLDQPPDFCQYTGAECDQDFTALPRSAALFLYPSEPATIAQTVQLTADRLKNRSAGLNSLTWRELPIQGQIIFCEICKALRGTEAVIADVTTLNFNVLFEIGFALGLGLPVIPIRDKTYDLDKKAFTDLGLLDTIGYVDFSNSDGLTDAIRERLPAVPLPRPPKKTYLDTPIYVLKGPVETEGAIQLLSALKKSALRFRTYDPVETPRLALTEARRQVSGSAGLVANLLSPQRSLSKVHNSLCALLCGIATAEGKAVLMLQEENAPQPIDYRDLVRTYTLPATIPDILRPFLDQCNANMQSPDRAPVMAAANVLERTDLGDPAAENEIGGLRNYFVPTGQYRQATQGHARLVVGRKGSGKTAMFYRVRDSMKGVSRVVLDLKPEGHQFAKLRDLVQTELSQGLREHTLVAFWNYILLCELAQKVLHTDLRIAERDNTRWQAYRKLDYMFADHLVSAKDDLSQRLLRQVDRLVERKELLIAEGLRADVTQIVFGGDIDVLANAVADYLVEKEAVCLLIDNLDKSWPTRGTTDTDIMILRTLLEAARKLQRELEEREIEFKCLVFIRTDVFEHLLRETPDKGKDTAIRLDWDDREVFKDIVARRVGSSIGQQEAFDVVWPLVAETHVGIEDSFNYIVDRTLMRPRDLLTFLQRAIETALNRGHNRITGGDIQQAEKSYSGDMLVTVGHEVGDVEPGFADAVYALYGGQRRLTGAELERALEEGGVEAASVARAIEVLTWFGYLGVESGDDGGVKYSYEVRYDLRQLLRQAHAGARFVVHPAFVSALALKD